MRCPHSLTSGGTSLCYIPDYSIPVEDYKAAVLILNRCYLLLGLLTTSSYPTPSSGLALQNTPRLQSKSNPPSWLWAHYQVSLLWGNKEGLSVYAALNKADTALVLHRKGLIRRDAKNPDLLHTIVEYESMLRSLLIRLTGVCSSFTLFRLSLHICSLHTRFQLSILCSNKPVPNIVYLGPVPWCYRTLRLHTFILELCKFTYGF